MTKDVTTLAVVGTFQCQHQLTQQRNLTITGHIYSDDTAEELNARVDLYQDVLDRQFIRCDIVNMEAQIKAQMAGIEQFRDQLSGLAARAQGKAVGLSADAPRPPKLSSHERLALQNGEQTIRKAQDNIDGLRERINAAKQKLGIPVA